MSLHPAVMASRGDRPQRPDARWFSKPLVNWRRPRQSQAAGRGRGLPSTRALRITRPLSLPLSRLFALIAQRPVVDEGEEEEGARAIP